MATTVGRLLLEDAVPPEFHGALGTLDKAGIKTLLHTVATERPHDFRPIVKRLYDLGARAAFESGGLSPGLKDLVSPPGLQAVRDELHGEVTRALADASLTPRARDRRLVELVDAYRPRIRAALDAHAADNQYYRQAKSGAKGSVDNVQSLIAGDLLYSDPHFRPIPFPVLRSYGEGVEPHHYLAGAFGARQGLWLLKGGTAKAGFAAKRVRNAVHRLVVLDHDGPHAGLPDGPRGLPVPTDDPDNEGARLGAPAGGYPRDTLLTPAVLADLQGKGHKTILLRSPAVGGPPGGGVYGYDVGLGLSGQPAQRGEFAGLNAADAISGPMTQSVISSKHCLFVETLVRMADGTERRIDAVEPGEYVLGADITGRTFPVRVVARHDNGVRPCYETVLRYWEYTEPFVLRSTLDHKVLGAAGAGDAAYPLPIGELVARRRVAHAVAGFDSARPADALYVLCLRGETPKALGDLPTCDLEVDHPDHLFVLANGLIVSNSGGVSGGTKAQEGFPVLDRLISIPAKFPGGATHARLDGVVGDVRPAPQGGWLIPVGGETHYADPEREVRVRPGDTVEAGDVLTDGTPNPAEFVRHKGVGEGRRLFVAAFRDAARAAGFRPHRRNLELLARGLIDHVRLDEEVGAHVPGDVVGYTDLEHQYRPREGAAPLAPRQARGQYLEAPVLHYSIGTRLTPRVADELHAWGVPRVLAHPEPPRFTPVMLRSHDVPSADPDWLARTLGSRLVDRAVLEGAHRGLVSDPRGTSFVPHVAAGTDLAEAGELVPRPAKAGG